MKIVAAPDSFKDSLSATDAAQAMLTGFCKVYPGADCVAVPMADGGEGSVDTVLSSGGERIAVEVTGPLGERFKADYALINGSNTAFIEMAQASGLEKVKADQRNPWDTTSYGTGELIVAALNRGCEDIVVGVGGSATQDGGAGALTALGFRFLDAQGKTIPKGARGLLKLHRIDASQVHPGIANCRFRVATDVSNPLLGPQGSAYIYAKQKGAKDEDLEALDQALDCIAKAIEDYNGKDIRPLKASGAAGGMGGGLQGLIEAEMVSGVALIASIVGLDRHLENASLVLTGEGQINRQTDYGKVVVGIADLAKKRNIPVIALTGSLGEGYDCVYARGIDAIQVISPGCCSLEQCLANAKDYLNSAAERAARMLKLGNLL